MGKLRHLEGSGLELSPVSQLWSQSPEEARPGLLAGPAPLPAPISILSSILVLEAQAPFLLGFALTTLKCGGSGWGSEGRGQPKGRRTSCQKVAMGAWVFNLHRR